MNRTRLAAIAGHEARTQLRSPAFWVLLVILLAITSTLNPVAMIPSGEIEVGGERAFANSPHALAQSFAIGSFFAYTFFAALMAGFAVIRDDESGIGDLLHATPLTAGEHAVGKLSGVAAALGVALAVHLALALLFYEGPALFGTGSAAHGPFRAIAYLGAAALFALPGIAWTAAVAFAIGARSRRPMAVYAVPTVLFVYTILISWNFAPATLGAGWDRLLAILDPTAIRWLDRVLFRIDRGVAYWNTAAIEFDWTFVLNRLLALGIAGGAVVASIRRPSSARRRRREARDLRALLAAGPPPGARAPDNASFRPLADLAMTGRAPGLLAGTGTILRAEVGELFRQPALYLFSAFLMLVVAEVAGTEAGLFGSPVLLTAGGIAVRSLPVVTVLVCLYLLFVVVESMHRDSVTGFATLFHAAPVSDTAILLGKGLASTAVIAVLSGACVGAGLALLLLQNGGRIEIGPLLLVYGAVLAPTYLLWAAFVSAVMVVLRSRNGTIAIGLAALAGTAVLFVTGGLSWVTNWPLWGALRWTDMGTFPLNGRALLWNRAAALAVTLFLFLLSRALLVRTERDAAASATRLHRGRLMRASLRLVPFLLLPLLIQGFLAIGIRQGAEGEPEIARAADYFRRNVAAWSAVEPPRLARIDLRIDLEPAERRMALEGSYELENATAEPMARLPFTLGSSFGTVAWRIEGAAPEVEGRSGLDVLTLQRPLAPGETVRVDFAYEATYPRGFSRNGGGAGTFILPAGVLLSTHRGEFLPVPGFVAPASDVDATEGASLSPPPSPGSRAPSFETRVEVSVPSDYSVTSVGVQRREWSAAGRRHAVWESARPVAALSLMAGRWEIRREGDNAVYFHAGHAEKVDEILATLGAARARFSEWFHPYPWKELRLAEFPDLDTEATSYPTLISFSEGIGFLDAGEGPGGVVFSVTAHEVAHQWWGHLLPAAEGPGTGLLVEGLAHYSALLLHESELGAASRIAFACELERLYLEQRRASERPVLVAEEGRPGDEATLALKGAWVLWMLHGELGREAMLAGLRDLVGRHAESRIEATPEDLLSALAAQAKDPAALRSFAAPWLTQVVLPEFEVTGAAVERTAAGWRARATVRNVGTGQVTVEVAALGPGSDPAAEMAPGAGNPRLRTARLGPGRAETLEWSLDFRPARIEVDPGARVLQRNRERARADLDGEPILASLQVPAL
ncbi:MAG: ABC transporter permease subunit [Thermoanaerobaculia bacterium]|nr:ABC transporter permease subunit [Thermoanaerobaculia bacterium]